VRKLLLILLSVDFVLLVVSGIGPYDRLTWWLEIFPILIAAPLLIVTYRRFPLTHLAYVLIFLHSLILMMGGHYTYARTPLGFWAQDFFHLARNPYDRLGHFAQGFVPALLARELLLRKSPLKQSGWLNFIVVCICLSISVSYEFIEWWSAVLLGQGAQEFLGTQGDVWDTQWDMFLAGVGAVTTVVLLSRWHDRQLQPFLKGKK
jgi:putative membrane protein